MKQVLSPRDLAAAIGVSESSIKRWVDDGVISATRTAGGHRRIAPAEVVRFIRESRSELVRPEVLGLGDLAAVKGRSSSFSAAGEAFYQFLRTGAATEARGLFVSLYLEGRSVAQIADGPLRDAMRRIGDHWGHEPAAIFWEHRATEIAIQAMSQLRGLFEPAKEAPAAVGGAPSGDPYILASLTVAVALEAQGLRAVNLGPDTPLPTLERGIELVDPKLIWLSVSAAGDLASLARDVESLLDRLVSEDRSLIIGGRQALDVELPPHPKLHLAGSMSELEAYVKGLLAPSPPTA